MSSKNIELFLMIPFVKYKLIFTFAPLKTVDVAQSVRVVVCGTIGRGFEPHLPPKKR